MNLDFKYTQNIVNSLESIERCKVHYSHLSISDSLQEELRKESKLQETHYSTAIEGNSLSYEEVKTVIERNRKPQNRNEREVINYYDALLFLDDAKKKNTKVTLELINKIHDIVEKKGKLKTLPLRTPTPPGVLFAVFDSVTKTPSYIPPESNDIPYLLDELINFYNNNSDLPIVLKASIMHYGLVTIHPYEDGNGRTARLLTNYILLRNDYDFNGQLCMEKYYYEKLQEYYSSLSMDLSELYYEGRENPPHLEIWIEYFCRIMEKNTNELVKKR